MSGKPPETDRFLTEILDQPGAMRAAAVGLGGQLGQLDELHRLGRRATGIVLTGMGSCTTPASRRRACSRVVE